MNFTILNERKKAPEQIDCEDEIKAGTRISNEIGS